MESNRTLSFFDRSEWSNIGTGATVAIFVNVISGLFGLLINEGGKDLSISGWLMIATVSLVLSFGVFASSIWGSVSSRRMRQQKANDSLQITLSLHR